MPLALGAIPDAEAKADALPPDRAAGDAAKPADKPRGAVVTKNVVWAEHQKTAWPDLSPNTSKHLPTWAGAKR
jgi:hypothetical protein